ncbi:hypothetical protein BY458DRAFT_434677 [Sporodiniella umbellata]|nr:hypothetical protein BY458DRAFT_434677 [Sporodiniella umbellata]
MRTPRKVFGAVYSHVIPENSPNPKLLAISESACQELDLDYLSTLTDPESTLVFSGNTVLENTRPWSLCYAGHQFGYFAGQLGDGRAISLFETKNNRGEKWELQLKGAGRTPYSRFADGYAVLRSSIREFLMSEYMHALNIPTTRALALVSTDREVYREKAESGAIVTRMAPSWLRFGNFEIFYSRDDMENVRVLADYAIENVVPEDKDDKLSEEDNKYARFFRNVAKRTAHTVADWQSIGFNHGVLNTDNMSIMGLTMDYGPFQIMDYYDPGYVCNHSDEGERYAFHRQPNACLFNLVKLSIPFYELIGAGKEADNIVFPKDESEGPTTDKTISVDSPKQNEYSEHFKQQLTSTMRAKLGLLTEVEDDLENLITPLFDWMSTFQVDYHRFYRTLSNYQLGSSPDLWADDIVLDSALMKSDCLDALGDWSLKYHDRLLKEEDHLDTRKTRMDSVNPRFVLRNAILEDVIQGFDTLDEEEAQKKLQLCLDACTNPFKESYEEQVEKWIQSQVSVS